MDGVSRDLIEYRAGGGVDGRFGGDLGKEVGVGGGLGFVDEDRVERVRRVEVVLEDE